jgi:hypothetical protein
MLEAEQTCGNGYGDEETEPEFDEDEIAPDVSMSDEAMVDEIVDEADLSIRLIPLSVVHSNLARVAIAKVCVYSSAKRLCLIKSCKLRTLAKNQPSNRILKSAASTQISSQF